MAVSVILDKNLINNLANLKNNVQKANQTVKIHNANFLGLSRIKKDGVDDAAAVFSVAPIQQELDDLYDILNATNTVTIGLTGTTLNISNAGTESSIDLTIYRMDVFFWTLIKWSKNKIDFRDAEFFGLKDVVNIPLVAGAGSYNIASLVDVRDEVLYVEANNSVFPYDNGKFQKKNNHTASEYDTMVKKIFRYITVP